MVARQKNPRRMAAARRNPWIKHIKSTCAPKYRRGRARAKKRIAATTLQRVGRGFLARRRVRKLRVEKHKEEKQAKKPKKALRRTSRQSKARVYLRDEQASW